MDNCRHQDSFPSLYITFYSLYSNPHTLSMITAITWDDDRGRAMYQNKNSPFTSRPGGSRPRGWLLQRAAGAGGHLTPTGGRANMGGGRGGVVGAVEGWWVQDTTPQPLIDSSPGAESTVPATSHVPSDSYL